jgi:hypothetical protein
MMLDRYGRYSAHTYPASQDSAGGRWVVRHPPAISALATAVGAVIWIAYLPRVGTDLSAALWTELSAGRAAFTLGLAAAIGCVMVADIGVPRSLPRLAAAAALALLTCLFSPVAAVFLWVVAVVVAFAGRWAEAITICVAAALPLGVMAFFADGGSQPAAPQTWIPPVFASVATLVLIPRRWRLVRIGAVIYGIAVLVTWQVPTLVGSSIERLGELLAGPLVVGLGSSRHRWLLAAGLIAAGVWQVAQPVADLSSGNAPGYAPQTAALVRELVTLHADTARVEAVPQYGHWESQQLASVVPLARGWERQLDIARNPIFYSGGVLIPAAYYRWLRFNAVRYVAISATAPDWAAVAEADVVRAGQPWLIPVWHDAYWALYRFAGAAPLASTPATVIRTSPAQVVLRMRRPGTTIVRVRWSRLLQAGGAVVTRRGPWVAVTASRAGMYTLSAPY